jgi:archaellum biogenesis ATPase FlaH
MMLYSLADFADVPVVAARSSAIAAPIKEIPELHSFGADVTWNDELVELYNTDTPRDRSQAIMEAAYLAAEERWADEQILSLIYHLDDRWQKYTARETRHELILDILERARSKVGYEGFAPAVLDGFLEKHHAVVLDDTEVMGFNDFLARSYPISWVFDGLLSHGGIGLVTGWPGAGKTTFTLQMAAAAALGQRFLRWDSTGPVKVLYLSLEMAAPPLHLFVTESKKEFTNHELSILNKNLLLAPFGVPLHIDREDGYERLKGLLEQHKPDVVIIDSLSMMTPKDLTDEEAMKTLFDGLAVIRQEHDVSFLVVHHNRKKAADAQKSKGVELSDVYGSTYITAKVDFAINLTKMEEKNLIQLTTLKNRLGVEPDPFELIRSNMKFSDPSEYGGFLGQL